jgi:hypothetical protein
MQRMKSTLAALGCALAIASATVAPALAGEVTGNGKDTAAPDNANSICAYSGQNDGNPPGGKTQSYGQDVKAGRADPHAFNPGDACQGGSNRGRTR